jgi:hypothetical protein
MGIFVLFQDGDVVQFDVEELVDRFEDPLDGEVIFQFDCDFLVDKCFEEGIEHCRVSFVTRTTYAL